MATELKVPEVGESIREVEIGDWRKRVGDWVEKDEPIVVIESEKATVEIPSPISGKLGSILKKKGESVAVGAVIGTIEPGIKPAEKEPAEKAAASAPKPPPTARAPEAPRVMPSAKRVMAEQGLHVEQVKATGPGGRILKEDALRAAAESSPPSQPGEEPERDHSIETSSPAAADVAEAGSPQEEIVRMSRLRRTVAERLVQAQRQAALLTTFNEIDMSGVVQLRKDFGELFLQKYQTKLGFMSFFVKASVDALKQIPQVNAEIRGEDIVFKNHYDIGVAIGGGKGLVVPVIRNAERLSFAEIELAIADFARRAKENKLQIDELHGGTFTISNGGVYGSLLSTPIVNPPQSGILGLHAIQDRPVARDGAVVIRPMMYAALTYDHRIVDGREAVTFLKRIKEILEAPSRLLLEI